MKNKFPKVNYIGNKEKISSWICDFFPKDVETVFDAFSGGCSLSYEAKKRGYKVIKNLGGHGIGRSLHEEPDELLNCRNRYDQRRFKKNAVVAIETFISTISTYADTLNDGWTLVGDRGGYMAQHEHTIVVTDKKTIILTEMNGIWD